MGKGTKLMNVGGRITLLLAGEKPDTVIWGQQQPTDEEAGVVKKGPFIKAGAIAHATSVTREDFEGTKAPLAFICVENDQLFSEEIREHGVKYLKENDVESEFKIYSGVPHGFAVIGDYEDASIKAEQTEAFGQMLAWLKSH
jgi:dienelactone hydrolase